MKVGDMVSQGRDTGLFLGLKTFPNGVAGQPSYTCAEVYWCKSQRVGTIQTDLLRVINDA
jgi:hypothetical protein